MDIQTAYIEIQRFKKFFVAVQKIEEVLAAANVAEGTVKNLESITKKIKAQQDEFVKVEQEVVAARKEADTKIKEHKARESNARRLVDASIEEMHRKNSSAREEYERENSARLDLHEKQKAHLASEIKSMQDQVENTRQQKADLEAALAALRQKASAL